MSGLASFFGSFPHGFMNISRWNGRDRRVQFWPYFLLCLLLATVFQTVVLLQLGPLLETPKIGASAMVAHWLTTMKLKALASISLLAPLIILTGAAVVRRLHDGGWSGRWLAGLLFIEIVQGAGMMIAIGIALISPSIAAIIGMACGLLLVISVPLYIWLFAMLCWNTDREDTRYGAFQPTEEDRLRWLATAVEQPGATETGFAERDWHPV